MLNSRSLVSVFLYLTELSSHVDASIHGGGTPHVLKECIASICSLAECAFRKYVNVC